MSKDLVNDIFELINNISSENVKSSKLDKTVIGKVVKIQNADSGEYKVSYQDNIFSAFNIQDLTTVYNPDEDVYILVPEGNFSNKKLILGYASSQNSSYQNSVDMKQFYEETSPNLLEDGFYGCNRQAAICAALEEDKTNLTSPANYKDIVFFRDQPHWTKGEYDAAVTNYANVVAAYDNDLFDTNQAYRETAATNLLNLIEDPLNGIHLFGVEDRYVDAQTGYPSKWLTNNELSTGDELFSKYSQGATHIKIEADFQTLFASEHNNGDYALRVDFLKKNPKYVAFDDQGLDDPAQICPEYTIVSYYLGSINDLTFTGNYYHYTSPSHQSAYFSIAEESLLSLYKVSLVQDGQVLADTYQKYNEYGEKEDDISKGLNGKQLTSNNIICSNISIKFCQQVTLNDGLYHAYITCPLGNYLYDTSATHPVARNSVKLIAHLHYGYSDIISQDNCLVKWFRRDSSVTLSTPDPNIDKDKYGKTWVDYSGAGWRPIEKLIYNDPTQYELDFDELVVNYDAVEYKWDYKCVIVYLDEDENIVTTQSATTTIENLDSAYDLEIVCTMSTDQSKMLLSVVDHNDTTVVDKKNWYAYWYTYTSDGTYYLLNDVISNEPLEINSYLTQDIVWFRCLCYDPYKKEHEVGGAVTLITTAPAADLIYQVNRQSDSSLKITWDYDQIIFNYDSNGQLINTKDKGDHWIKPYLQWADNAGMNYKMEFHFSNDDIVLGDIGKVFNAETGGGVTSDKSMLENVWRDAENCVHFRVKDTYDQANCLPGANTITVRIYSQDAHNQLFVEDFITVSCTKDGDNGTHGNEWIAPIKLVTDGKNADAAGSGDTWVKFKNEVVYDRCLVVIPDPDDNTKLKQEVTNSPRVYLRPFVAKSGKYLEEYPDSDGYFYRIYWDVRFPSGGDGEKAYRANLRLAHADTHQLFNNSYTTSASIETYEMGPHDSGFAGTIDDSYLPTWYSLGLGNNNGAEDEVDGLRGYTQYPSMWPGGEDINDDVPAGAVENYGAVEIQWRFNGDATGGDNKDKFDGNHTFTSLLNHYAIVTATVAVYKGGIIARKGGKAYLKSYGSDFALVQTFSNTYPVDIFYDFDSLSSAGTFHDTLIYTNWPKNVMYNANGYEPEANDKKLEFYYGGTCRNVNGGGLTNINPKLIQTTANYWPSLEAIPGSNSRYDDTTTIEGYKYIPPLQYPYSPGAVGVMYTDTCVDFGSGFFMRNQIFEIQKYANTAINGWNGQALSLLDTDDDEQTDALFCPTIGAGYKDALNNTFTGVVIGVDGSQKRDTNDYTKIKNGTAEYRLTYIRDKDELKRAEYMTGVYGYQQGEASFGLMENGTAFFGQKSGGGRIIMDGRNGCIYGGANGELTGEVTVDDPMWNTLRINLVDLRHTYTTDPATGEVKWDAIKTSVDTATGEEKATDANTSTVVDDTRLAYDATYLAQRDQPYITVAQLDSFIEEVVAHHDWDAGGRIGPEPSVSTAIWSANDSGTRDGTMPMWYQEMWTFGYIKAASSFGWQVDQGYLEGYNPWGTGQNKIDNLYEYNVWLYKSLKPYFPGQINKPSDLDFASSFWADLLGMTQKDFYKSFNTDTTMTKLNNIIVAKDSTKLADFHLVAIPVNYWTPESSRTTDPGEVYRDIRVWSDTDDDTRFAISTYGPSKASTTPAIEIGQHIHGLRPAPIGYDDYKEMMSNMYIPGDRNFMVTYDGTMWAMNGVFMGNVIGSNIAGGTIIGATVQTGAGYESEDDPDYPEILSVDYDNGDSSCDYLHLLSPDQAALKAGMDGMTLTSAAGIDNEKIWAERAYIFGGSIDIGSFHIRGKNANDPDAYGRLYQFGESDFMGTTHFYGNVGIGMNERQGMEYKSGTNGGNLLQTHGLVALGIYHAAGETTEQHELIIHDHELSGYAFQGEGINPTPDDIDSEYFTPDTPLNAGQPHIGDVNIKKVEQYAPFVIDTRILPQARMHFWPFSHNIFKEVDEDGNEFYYAYLQTMNMFYGKSFDVLVDNLGLDTSTRHVSGANYFRVAPGSVEAVMINFTSAFQPEGQRINPYGEENANEEYTKGRYNGQCGFIVRAVGNDMGADTVYHEGFGLRSRYRCPLLLLSDENFGITARGAVWNNYLAYDDDWAKLTNGERTYIGNGGKTGGAEAFGCNEQYGIENWTANYSPIDSNNWHTTEMYWWNDRGPMAMINFNYPVIKAAKANGTWRYGSEPNYTTGQPLRTLLATNMVRSAMFLSLPMSEDRTRAGGGASGIITTDKGIRLTKFKDKRYTSGTAHVMLGATNTVAELGLGVKEGDATDTGLGGTGAMLWAQGDVHVAQVSGSHNRWDEPGRKYRNEIYLSGTKGVVIGSGAGSILLTDWTDMNANGHGNGPNFFRLDQNGVYLTGDIWGKPENQHGIYARFA